MKLKVKFTLIVSGFVIIAFVLTAFSVFSRYSRSIKATVAQQQFLMISMLADELDGKIVGAHQLLIAAAKTIPPEAMRNPVKAQSFLDGKYGLHTIFDNHLLLLTSSGKIFAESQDIGRRGFDLSFREYVVKTLKTKKPYISDPYVSTQSHRHPVIMLTVPLLDRKGEIMGIFCGSIDLMRDNFLGRISTVKIGKTGYLYLTAADRTLIIHPDKKRILTKQAPGSNRLYDRAIDGFEGSDDTRTSYGIKMLSSCKWLKAKKWILLANYPAVEAYRPIRQAKDYFLIATIIVISAVFCIISFIMKSLLNPLQLFTRHIEALPQKTGDDRFLNINTEDEVGILSRAFNKMVTEIDSKRAELEGSEELYRTVTEFSSDLVFWITPDNKVIYVSPNCEKFCGYTQNEFYSSTELLETIIHPDDRPIWAEHNSYLKNRHDLHEQLEFRMITKSGQIRWISHNCRAVYDKEGNYKGRRGSHHDITAGKQAEESLSRLAAIVESSDDAIIGSTLDCIITSWNSGAEKLYGYANEEAFGNSISLVVPPDRLDDSLNLTEQITEGKPVKHFETVHKKKNGDLIDVSITMSPVKDLMGRIIGVSAIVRDISEKKKVEGMLRQLSTKDGLTGIANRRAFDEFLNEEWRRALRNKYQISVLMIDVDFFKKYNDTYGHLKGDECLRSVAAVLNSATRRAGDMSARFGGEEFVVILPVTDTGHAVSLAEKIRRDIEALEMPHERSKISSYVTVSIGVVSALPDKNMSSTDLIRCADEALYRAKEEGRNRVVFKGISTLQSLL